jgi:hypothetical protein
MAELSINMATDAKMNSKKKSKSMERETKK